MDAPFEAVLEGTQASASSQDLAFDHYLQTRVSHNAQMKAKLSSFVGFVANYFFLGEKVVLLNEWSKE